MNTTTLFDNTEVAFALKNDSQLEHFDQLDGLVKGPWIQGLE